MWSIRDPVGSKARPGSEVLIVNELSMTSVGAAVRAATPFTTSTNAAARATPSAWIDAARLARSLFTAHAPLWGKVELSVVRSYWTSGAATSLARSAGDATPDPSGWSQQAAERAAVRVTSGGSSTSQ